MWTKLQLGKSTSDTRLNPIFRVEDATYLCHTIWLQAYDSFVSSVALLIHIVSLPETP